MKAEGDYMTLRPDFIWGVSTASIQIEGGSNPSERALSNWDIFCETHGKVYDGHNALISSDHFHHLEEDVAIIKQLGVKAYRFSVSWPRILPDGTGTPNPEGIAFYNRLIDDLLLNGIEPYLTVYHWDLPYPLHQKGGWLNPEIPNWMEEYARVVVDAFSDRVSNWITINEPQCFINESYCNGVHAPGYNVSNRELAQAVHNALMAHGKIVQVIRQSAKLPAKISYAQATPLSSTPNSDADIEVARKRQFSLPQAFAGSGVIYSDPIFLGQYPAEYLSKYESILPRFGQNDMQLISQPIDYFGINLYFGDKIATDKNNEPVVLSNKPGFAKTAFGWPVNPECMYWANKFCYERYGVPMLITENGMSGNDWVHLDGHVHDHDRIDFIHRYLLQMERAIQEGVDIRGYFHWSLMDNFEWARGYSERFGIVHVDFQTGKRTIKDSAFAYSEIIRRNTACL